MTRLSDAEIMDRYEAARDKEKELDNLAVACRTDRRGMRAKLAELGLLDESKGKTEKSKKKRKRIDGDAVRGMCAEGKTDREIAEALGAKEESITNWRSRHGVRRAKGLPTAEAVKKKAEAKETSVKVAEDAAGMTVAALSDLLATLDKLGEVVRVTAGGKVIRSVFVGLRFDGKNGHTPAEMTVDLEAD